MGASPKTTEFLKECMADALLQAMKEKPFPKITVNEITEIAGVKVLTRKDYSTGIEEDLTSGARTGMELKGSNVLKYKLADGTDLVVRPSGTEPKVKVYILAQGDNCPAKVAAYAAWADTLKQ